MALKNLRCVPTNTWARFHFHVIIPPIYHVINARHGQAVTLLAGVISSGANGEQTEQVFRRKKTHDLRSANEVEDSPEDEKSPQTRRAVTV
ncbi:hypothetical protein AMELA_G00128240 [Ameiurus melas]|uniref:Uncharacterized protein n=1 Tax=Ameiurus melas TaxID=219545 RepID=A0A7J6ANN6_AMEME|nr:hypothetical protein AMELA_G00128240 [Ameiurus melas]